MNHKNTNFDFYRLNVKMKRLVKGKLYYQLYDYLKFYNCDKYKKTNTYKYIIKNAGKLLHTALTTVKNVIKDNSFMVDIIKQKVLNSKSDVEKIYLLNYLNNECGGQGKYDRLSKDLVKDLYYE